jgi:hypothetical protein
LLSLLLIVVSSYHIMSIWQLLVPNSHT